MKRVAVTEERLAEAVLTAMAEQKNRSRRSRKMCVWCAAGTEHTACRQPAPPSKPLFRREPVLQKGRSYVSPTGGFRGVTGPLARALLAEPNLVLV
ncbi:hypothetical protein LCGC14_3153210 [marine sediment metagenome]|uniref:Uncharacterized protein n=1 Tax=marine sediment metagenome TaxID=412755 RepID=A0A0F8YHX4_9ZZZZ